MAYKQNIYQVIRELDCIIKRKDCCTHNGVSEILVFVCTRDQIAECCFSASKLLQLQPLLAIIVLTASRVWWNVKFMPAISVNINIVVHLALYFVVLRFL